MNVLVYLSPVLTYSERQLYYKHVTCSSSIKCKIIEQAYILDDQGYLRGYREWRGGRERERGGGWGLKVNNKINKSGRLLEILIVRKIYTIRTEMGEEAWGRETTE